MTVRIAAAALHVPGMSALHFIADANAARAQNAAVVVNAETLVADVHRQMRILRRKRM